MATITQVGAAFALTAPGVGAVLFDVGKIVFDAATGAILFQAGPHQVANGDFTQFCAALAGTA